MDQLEFGMSLQLGAKRFRLETRGRGVWPDRDPWGESFGDSYFPDMKELAGQALCGGWRAVLDGLQGDQDWLVATLRPKRVSITVCSRSDS